MSRPVCLTLLVVAGSFSAMAADTPDVVFRSDVSLVRVDAQVIGRDNRAITGLRAEDFVLLDEGKPLPIRNFASEDMPVDVLLLFDVSASMRPNVARIASAAHQALWVLREQDRVGIMVFDRSTRVRMPFRSSRAAVEQELEAMLNDESFNGGTDINRGLLDAAAYIGREGRREARRAIIIVTDDQTERERDEDAVSRALTRANAVLSALIAPDAMRYRNRRMGGGNWPNGGGSTWPGGGMGGPLGGIILGRRGPYGGRRGQGGPVMIGSHTHSAGTAEIARRSGGDSMPVDQASALEDTLQRIRQRYALHFYLPEGARPGQERNIEVRLSAEAYRRYPEADVLYRHVYMVPEGVAAGTPAPVVAQPAVITQAPADPGSSAPRRRAVNESPVGSHVGPMIGGGSAGQTGTPPRQPAAPSGEGGWRRVDQPASPSGQSGTTPAAPQSGSGAWRRVKMF